MAAEQAQPVLLHHAMPIKVIWVIQSYNTSMHSMHDDVLPNFQKTKASAARTILLPALAGWASLHQNKNNSACLVSPFKVTPFLEHEFKQPLKIKTYWSLHWDCFWSFFSFSSFQLPFSPARFKKLQNFLCFVYFLHRSASASALDHLFLCKHGICV